MSKYKELLEEYESSGLSGLAFAKEKGLSPSCLYYRLNKAREKNQGQQFVPIKVKPKENTRVVRITTASGLTIEIPL